MDLNSTFVRNFEVDNSSTSLRIHQVSVGDVGCVVWDAALVLAKYLIANEDELFLKDSAVVELGSGTALAGITAAALGANAVVTDLEDFVPLMEKNIACNRHALKGSVQAQALRWGDPVDHLAKPRIVLVSDCLYYTESLEPLVKTLRELSDADTKVIFCYEQRDSEQKRELEAKFFKLIEESFAIHKVPAEHFHPDYCSPDIHVVIFHKKAGHPC